MLVVDRAVFGQLQADHTGIDFMELSANLIRAQRLQTGSSHSFLESDATSKGISPTSVDFLPPTYEEIFGTKAAVTVASNDLPPSYSEISVLFKGTNPRGVVDGSGVGRGARMVVRESVRRLYSPSRRFNPRSVSKGSCSFSTPNLCVSSGVQCLHPNSDGVSGGVDGVNSKFRGHRFCSLENNVEDESRDVGENATGASCGGGVQVEVVSSSGPNERTENLSAVKTKNRLRNGGRCDQEPSYSVQYLPTFGQSQIRMGDAGENEVVDRESSV